MPLAMFYFFSGQKINQKNVLTPCLWLNLGLLKIHLCQISRCQNCRKSENSKVRLHILGSEALGQRVPNILGKPIGSLCYAHRLHLCCCWCNYPKLPRAMLLHYIRGPNRLVTIYCTINCRLVALQRQWYTHYRGGGPLLHRGAEFGRSSQETCWRNNFCFCNFKFYSMKAELSPTCWRHSVMITIIVKNRPGFDIHSA